MLSFKKTAEASYIAVFQSKHEVLSRNDCYLVKKEVLKLLKSHLEVTIDLHGVKNIEKSGVIFLHELKRLMNSRKCTLRFVNADPAVSIIIADIERKKLQNEIGIGMD